MHSIKALVATFVLAIGMTRAAAGAELPPAARADPRLALGYLVVTAYPGVNNDGRTDSTAGLQQAIEDAREHNLTVLFPAGEYLISDTLRCFRWQVWSAAKAERAENTKQATAAVGRGYHALFGEVKDGRRPLLRLAREARGFDDPERIKPMLAFRMIRATAPTATKPVPLAHPLDLPDGFEEAVPILFGEKLCQIDFDCGGHAGAVGVHAPMAQDSTILDVRINAGDAYAGFNGLPGRNSVTGNIEVTGGRFGIINRGSIAGAVVVGARLHGQTENAIVHTDFSPLVVIGFSIRSRQGPALTIPPHRNTANAALSLVDGTIEVERGPVAMDNAVGKTVYLRNVHVRGADNLVRSGRLAPVPARPGWNRIDEYVHTDQAAPDDDPPYEVRDTEFRVFNLIEGRLDRAAQPIVRTSAGAPPADLIARHLWRDLPIHLGEADGTIVATASPWGARPDDDQDDAPAIQRAIDDASAAGHGRVFLPRGEYLIGHTLELRANTVLMGSGWHKTEIAAHPGWLPPPGEQPPMIRTVDDAKATTVLAMMTVAGPAETFSFDRAEFARGLRPEQLPARNRIGMIQWRAGRNSMSIGVVRTRAGNWVPIHQRLLVSFAQEFRGHGGGKHYSVHLRPTTAYPRYRPVLIDGTTEPLSIYGLNSESPYVPTRNEEFGMTNEQWLDRYALETNTEVRNARNVRIYGVKREGSSPTIIVRDSRNIALYSSGAMRNPVHPGLGGYIQFLGTNQDVLVAVAMVQSVKTLEPGAQQPLLRVERGGKTVQIEWPDSVAVYKEGEISDPPR